MSERLDKIYEAHCMTRQTTKAAFYLGYEVRLSEDIAPFKKLLNEKIEEIDRLTAELAEASTIANNNYEVILKCNRQINDLQRELARYRNGEEG